MQIPVLTNSQTSQHILHYVNALMAILSSFLFKNIQKAKRLQEKAIESSRYNERPPNAIFHQTDIKGLNTTVRFFPP